MKKQLLGLISQGKTEEAIEELLHFTSQLENKSYYEEIVALSARYEQHLKASCLGTYTHEENNVGIAQINKALIQLIKQLRDSVEGGEKVHEPTHQDEITSLNTHHKMTHYFVMLYCVKLKST